jgi:hypothetical protein
VHRFGLTAVRLAAAHPAQAIAGLQQALRIPDSGDTERIHCEVAESYQQWAEAGAQVRKGEKAAYVVFYKQVTAAPKASEAVAFLASLQGA